jgi:type II secretory pathway pseudopilin PulG
MKRARGFTLVEVLAALVASVLLLGGVAAIVSGAADMARLGDAELRAAMAIQNAFLFAERDLAMARLGLVSISTLDPAGDIVSFQVALPQPDGSVLFGAEGVEGQRYELRVAGGGLVRRTLDASGNMLRQVTLAAHLDAAGTTKPFQAAVVGAGVALTLRVREPAGRDAAVREATTTVAPRN